MTTASRHFELVADADCPAIDTIHCEGSGTITLADEEGTALAYTMSAGQTIGFRPTRILAVEGGPFYGWS